MAGAKQTLSIFMYRLQSEESNGQAELVFVFLFLIAFHPQIRQNKKKKRKKYIVYICEFTSRKANYNKISWHLSSCNWHGFKEQRIWIMIQHRLLWDKWNAWGSFVEEEEEKKKQFKKSSVRPKHENSSHFHIPDSSLRYKPRRLQRVCIMEAFWRSVGQFEWICSAASLCAAGVLFIF